MIAAVFVNYCAGCGDYTELDEDSKLCSACYEIWRAGAALKYAGILGGLS